MMDFHSVGGRVAAATLLALVFVVGCGGKGSSRPDGDAGQLTDARDGGDTPRDTPPGDGSPDATCEVPATQRLAGAACECGAQCASGFCAPEGVCCNEACAGGCETCTATGEVGTCLALPAGANPRVEGACQAMPTSSCGLDGTCDGAGQCRRHPAGTQCRQGSCDGDAVVGSYLCNGSGQCRPGATVICAPFACDAAAGKCFTKCSSNGMCVSGRRCQDESCGKLPNGAACMQAVQCESGFCADGVCCNRACTGACVSCNLPGHGGRCWPIDLGLPDPHGVCTDQGATSCGRNGTCDGLGGCSLYPRDTVCLAPSCSGNQLNTAGTCDGLGACREPGVQPCHPFRCVNGACTKDCRTNADCNAGIACLNNTCGPKLPGQSCTASSECLPNHHCTDGVCCESACTGPCRSCALPSAMGRCTTIAAGSPDPRSTCRDEGAASCGTNGRCDGTGGCQKYPVGTQCRDQSCAANVYTPPSTCNATGQCVAPDSRPCRPYICNGSQCFDTCAGDNQCLSPNTCRMNSCGLKDLGASCTLGNECLSGFCAQGFCCDNACSGACRSCALSGSQGTCTIVANGTVDPSGLCTDQGQPSCGRNGRCQAGACQLYASGAPCGDSVCASGTTSFTNTSTCNGTGMCVTPAPTSCFPYRCGTTNVCRGTCTSNADCASPAVCTNGSCGLKARGVACGGDNECLSGHCEQGFCCETACTGTCKSCGLASSRGTCSNVANGDPDPQGGCADLGAASCSTDGFCNGTGACRLYAAGTACVAPSCPAGQATLISGRTCNGAGVCQAATSIPCAPYVCNGTTACRAACTVDGDCLPPNICDQATNLCGNKKRLGQACASTDECLTGNTCVDSVCCSATACGRCQACNVAGSAGNCANVPSGTPDPRGLCAPNPPCGNTGACDGAGACQLASTSTACGTQTCTGSTFTPISSCNGMGACAAPTASSCSPYVCGGNACRTTCTADTDCLAPFTCQGTAPNRSCALKANGLACTGGAQCISGACVNGVCCGSPSCGTCQSCNVAGSAGTCANLPAGSPAPGGQCTAAPPCGNTGTCNGGGACTQGSSATQCSAPSCAANMLTQAAFCSGTGGACPAPTTVSCSPYVCESATACRTSCTADSHCINGSFYCNVGGLCVPKKGMGQACSAGNECGTGFCVDGVCCNSGSCGLCQSCNVGTSAGTCANLAAGTAAPATHCPAGGICGNTGTCNGAGACTVASSSTPCRSASCTGTTLTQAASCTGSGTCPAVTTVGCEPYVCGTNACKTSCLSNEDCANQATHYCTGAGGSCVPRQANGTACTGGNQCTSGNCVDGVCCGSPSCGICQACNLAGSAGTCTNVGAGATAPPGHCPVTSTCGNTGTCNGAGACQLASSSVMCGNASCTGSTFTPASFCSGSGTCQASTPTACPGGFVCGGGVCRTTCSSNADCANPTTHYCTGANGQCLPKQANGSACSGGNQCASGNCVDNVCCSSAACTTCQACNVGGSAGTCTTVPNGTPEPHGLCAQSPPCGNTGLCSGGACQLASSSVICADATCVGNTHHSAASCTGAGTCAAATTDDCTPYRCAASGCPTSCTSDTDCINASYYCSGAPGSCLPKRSNGAVCVEDRQCTSGNCTDGVCCSAPSCGSCQSCNVTGSQGMCANVPAGTPDPAGACVAQGANTCGTNGLCNGAGNCAVYDGNTICASSCGADLLMPVYNVSYCDGAGTCLPATQMSCSVACIEGTGCSP